MLPSRAPRRHVVLKMPLNMACARASALLKVPLKPLSANPKVSVLITNHNYGRFLSQAVESALTQSYEPKEVIVSDGGLQDNSRRIVESYIQRGAPVKRLHVGHQGMAASLNSAFRASSGEIICLLDADDYFLPGKIEAVVSGFCSEPEAGFAIHRTQMVDRHERQRGVYPLLSSLPRGDCLEATLHNAGVLMGLPPISSLSLRHDIALSIVPIPVNLSSFAEQMIHRIAPLVTSICAIDKPLSVWRLQERIDSNSDSATAERLECELSYMRDLWFEQNNFLIARDLELAQRMPALESNAFYMRTRYVLLKLLGDPNARECHSALCALSGPERSPVDFFWRYSLYLPRPVFRKCVDLLQRQSIWKEWLGRAVQRYHSW
jgi:glycosyltransferase involved in cell wall biosynthesis